MTNAVSSVRAAAGPITLNDGVLAAVASAVTINVRRVGRLRRNALKASFITPSALKASFVTPSALKASFVTPSVRKASFSA
jgi:hypothetical protein